MNDESPNYYANAFFGRDRPERPMLAYNFFLDNYSCDVAALLIPSKDSRSDSSTSG